MTEQGPQNVFFSELHHVAYTGNVLRLEALLSTGVDVDQRDCRGQTALISSSATGQKRCVEILLSNGANVALAKEEEAGWTNWTALHFAAAFGHLEVAKILVAAGADLETKNSVGSTIIHQAVQDGREKAAQVLAEAGADLEAMDSFGHSPLHRAMRDGHREMVEVLTTAGANLEAKDPNGCTPLQVAVQRELLEAIQVLVEKGANLEAKDPNGCTPLQVAVQRELLEATQVLAGAGADLEATNSFGYTPLHQAIRDGHRETVEVLTTAGANLEVKASPGGCTPLHLAVHCLAVQGEHWEAMQVLVEKGADLEATDSCGATPLHTAAGCGHWGVVRMLIGAGAKPNSRMSDGETPLYLAAQDGHLHAVTELLRANADPLLVKDQHGHTCTPLYVASYNGQLDIVREVVQQVGIEGCGGATGGVDALDIAARKQHLDIMVMLMDAGVVDSGKVLATAIHEGRERAVKVLLQRPSDKTAGGASYVDNKYDPHGFTPLLLSIMKCRPCTRRIVRQLIEAGADTSAVAQTNGVPRDTPWFNDTPLVITRTVLPA